MASDLTRPMSMYGGYPYSGAVERAGRRPAVADEDGRGSFGPVLVVLAVISFLAVSACIAGRLCGRRPSSAPSSRGEQKRESTAADAAEKGFGVMTQQPATVMRPVASSRATVHGVDDDVFEIKLCAPEKPPAAGWQGGGGGSGRALPRPPPAGPLGVPPQYAAVAAAAAAATSAAAGFRRAPPASSGAAVRQAHPHVLGRGNGGAPFVHGKRSR